LSMNEAVNFKTIKCKVTIDLFHNVVDSHGLTPVALKNELGNFSFDIHPRANACGPLLIWIGF
jgi:hypothetical protein